MSAQSPLRQDVGEAPTRRVRLEPVARVVGALGFDALVAPDHGQVLEAAALATLFRGYEAILDGRDVRDAVFISSRACGACGGAHATCSALAVEMAFGIQPPPMGIAIRNLMSALECLYDTSLQLFTRAGPDYSEFVIRETTPEVWRRAEQAAAPRRGVHGFARVSEILAALTRVRGDLYQEALQMARVAGEAYVVVGGKHPHPQTIVPGGISSAIDTSDLNALLLRAAKLLDYVQKVVAIWDDVVDFLYEAEPRYRDLGTGPMNFIDLGLWDDPLTYDASFQNCTGWGSRRWATPGVVLDGNLVTTSLPEINKGVEEFVEHSFYEPWASSGGAEDPLGNQLSGEHPTVKRTVAQPAKMNLAGKYSWCTAPRWNGHPMETGAYARLWTTALAAQLPHRRFTEATGSSLKLALPQGALPAAELEWHVPDRWGTLERTRARAYALAFAAVVAYEHALGALDFKRTGEERIATHFRRERGACAGTGFWGTPRGYLSHHLTVRGGVIENYQILGPTTWTLSPRDAGGTPGPCEHAVSTAPLVSRGAGGAGGGTIDILRTIRSFDPCMPCATH